MYKRAMQFQKRAGPDIGDKVSQRRIYFLGNKFFFAILKKVAGGWVQTVIS